MQNHKLKPVAIAVGAAFAASMAMTTLANTEGDLFAAEELDPRYDLLADAHGGSGDEEGSCGDKDDEEGSCGDKDDEEGSCGDKDDEEGSCGEGSCGDNEEE